MNPFARKPGVKLNVEIDPLNHWTPRGYGMSQIADACGYIPSFLTHIEEGQTVQDCFQRTYAHGGGWQPFTDQAFKVEDDGLITYPGDPPFIPYCKITMGNGQTVFIYSHGVVMVREADMKYEIARLD